jgi:hypothetical protein
VLVIEYVDSRAKIEGTGGESIDLASEVESLDFGSRFAVDLKCSWGCRHEFMCVISGIGRRAEMDGDDSRFDAQTPGNWLELVPGALGR